MYVALRQGYCVPMDDVLPSPVPIVPFETELGKYPFIVRQTTASCFYINVNALSPSAQFSPGGVSLNTRKKEMQPTEEKLQGSLGIRKLIQLFTKILFFKMSHLNHKGLTRSSRGNKAVNERIVDSNKSLYLNK